MPDYSLLCANLEQRGFSVRFFPTAEEASAYLQSVIRGKTVGAGGSETLRTMGLLDALAVHNTVYSHSIPGVDRDSAMAQAASAQVYLSSLNGLSETGELINIDGRCNRVSATLHGHEAVYFIVGRNKIAPTFDQALWRARNIAAPQNARRLNCSTPCVLRGDRCYDCSSPDRICRGLVVLWSPPLGVDRMEIVLVDQDLGF